jgi:hypothetical protein
MLVNITNNIHIYQIASQLRLPKSVTCYFGKPGIPIRGCFAKLYENANFLFNFTVRDVNIKC